MLTARQFTKVCGLERQPDSKPLTDAIKVVAESDYRSACRDAVAMAREVIRLRCEDYERRQDCINPGQSLAWSKNDPACQAAQRVIEAYGEEGK